MRPYLLFLTLLMIAVAGLTTLVRAQDSGGAEPASLADGAIIPPPPNELTEPVVWQVADMTPVALTPNLVLAPLADAAADACDLATSISFVPQGTPASSQTVVNGFTNEATDPNLTCLWGRQPPSLRGFRTAWYKFTPEYNGLVTISTRTSTYDTVLGIFSGSCGAFSNVACNDDSTGFTSEVTFVVRRDVTYYVEVADWQPAELNRTLQMNLTAAYNTPLVSEWQDEAPLNTPAPMSRHASVVVGEDIYLLGGLTGQGGLSSAFYRYHTGSRSNTPLAPIPGGIINTTAVYLQYTRNSSLQREIHVPGGGVGVNDSGNSSTHWIYNVGGNFWDPAPTAVPGSIPFAYAAAAPNIARDGFYLLGGVEGPGWPNTAVISESVRSDVLFYNALNRSWTAEGNMDSPRYAHTAARFGGRVCVAGGLNWDADTQSNLAFPNPIAECAMLSDMSTWTPTGPMNVPRYFAHSSVGPDGRWYVYGGIDGSGSAVPEVEYYDLFSNSWHMLPYTYDLGGRRPLDPAIIWPRGGFVGNQLWSLGGSIDASGFVLYPVVRRVASPVQGDYFLPFLVGGSPDNFTMAGAQSVAWGQTVSQNIASTENRHRFYRLVLPQRRSVQIRLTVPDGQDLDLFLYDDNKFRWGASESPFPGIDEQICLNNLAAGTYYIGVQHFAPPNPDTNAQFQLVARSVASCN